MEPSALIIAGPESLGPFFSAFLEKLLGFRSHVAAAYTGISEVLSALSQESYDLLLVTNNTLVADQIREVVSGVCSVFPGLAIIVVAQSDDAGLISDLVRRGANEFILMPFEADDLVASVKRHCHLE